MKMYRDADGELWAVPDDGRKFLRCHGGPWQGPVSTEWDVVESEFGPMVALTTDEIREQLPALYELVRRLGSKPNQ